MTASDLSEALGQAGVKSPHYIKLSVTDSDPDLSNDPYSFVWLQKVIAGKDQDGLIVKLNEDILYNDPSTITINAQNAGTLTELSVTFTPDEMIPGLFTVSNSTSIP